MTVAPAIAMPFAEIVERASQKTLLRFLTCGSVDDGKSTLIGRLLSDTKQIFRSASRARSSPDAPRKSCARCAASAPR